MEKRSYMQTFDIQSSYSSDISRNARIQLRIHRRKKMTLCGRIFGVKKDEVVVKARQRGIIEMDIRVSCVGRVYGGDVLHYGVYLKEINKHNSKPSLVCDKLHDSFPTPTLIAEGYVANIHLSNWNYPTAMGRAFEIASVLLQNGIKITVNGKSLDKEKEEYLDYIRRAVACQMSGL